MSKAKSSPDDLISTPEAGVELGVSASRVQALLRGGRLPGIKVGPTWVIRRGDLDLVRDRPPGRPRSKPQDPKPPAPKKKRP